MIPETPDQRNTIKQPVLETKGLSIGYRNGKKNVVIASGLNLHLPPGKLVCLLGANGTGKSTLLRTLAGLQAPLEGTVEIDGCTIASINKNKLAKKLSLVLTENALAGNLSVYEVLRLGRYPYAGWFGILNEKDNDIIREAIDVTGIAQFLPLPIHQLSDGERQKAMIARALIQDTPVIILDEPTAHLDLPNRVEIMQLLRKMVRDTGKAVILSTHELDLALQAGDEIWLIMPDKSLVTGMPEDLILNGTFENAFKNKGFNFSRETGTFKINYPQKGKFIYLKGEPIHFFWTKRALEREGFALSENSECVVEVIQEDVVISWILTKNSFTKSHHSLKHLFISLEEE